MKKYNLFKVLAITIFVAWLLTLFVPGSALSYVGELEKTGIAGVGVFGLLSNVNISISYFNGIAIFLVSVACFYVILGNTEIYQNFISATVKKFDGKQNLLVILTTIVFGLLSIFISDIFALIIFVPFIYKVMENLEIDKKVMLASTLVAALIGAMCSIYNETLFTMFSLKINTLLLIKVILFVLSISVLLALITPKAVAKKKADKKLETKKTSTKKVGLKIKKVNKIVYLVLTLLLGAFGINKIYAGNIKQGIIRLLLSWTLIPAILSVAEFITILTEKADKEGKIEVVSKRRKNVNFAVLLTIFTLFVIGTIIPWESLINKFTAFSDFNEWLLNIKVGKYAIFNNIVGTPVKLDPTTGQTTGIIMAFGAWQIIDLAILMFVLTGIIALSNNFKFDDFVSTITSGVKKILPVAITAMLISVVLVLMLNTGVNLTIANAILTLTKGFNIATSFIASLIGSVLTSDFYWFLSSTAPIFIKTVTDNAYYGVIAFIIQAVYNFVLIFAPTSIGLVAGLYYLNIPYNKWLKYIWKLLLALFIIIVVMSVIIFVLI